MRCNEGAGASFGAQALDLRHVAERLASMQAANVTVDITTRVFSSPGLALAKTPGNTPTAGRQYLLGSSKLQEAFPHLECLFTA